MSDAEMHRREASAIGDLGKMLRDAGMQPKPGGWLEGVLINIGFQNAASQIFSEWLSGIVDNPSGEVTEEHLERLKDMLRPHLTEFQRSRVTHDFLAGIIKKVKEAEEGREDDDID